MDAHTLSEAMILPGGLEPTFPPEIPHYKHVATSPMEPNMNEEKLKSGTDEEPAGVTIESEPAKPSESEEAGGWAFLLDSAQEYDKKQLEKWTDELNNLLVFAGIFSAVVTAYTIESYQWLQEDPAEKTNQLLTQISSQLASFSVTPTFVNATFQPLLSPPPFLPADSDVTINMLWFLSLTLSLLAAFFAIAAQQWLRSLPLPQHLSVRGTVYLRQRRHTAFIVCQVPHIITLLPVALQVAVVLFLVGLYHFLHEMDHSITTAATVIAGIPFILYAVSLFLPLVWPECPFKSPLVPSVIFILNWTFILLMTLATLFLLVPGFITAICIAIIWEYCTKSEAAADQAADTIIMKITDGFYAAVDPLSSLIWSSLNKLTNFWADREIRRCAHEDTWNLALPLEWAPDAVPNHQLIRLRPCLLRLDAGQRTECVLKWIILYHMGKFSDMDYGVRFNDQWSPIHAEILRGVNEAFAEQYKMFLLDAVPTEQELTRCDWVQVDPDLSAVLVLLTYIAKINPAEPDFRATVIHVLFRLLQAQRLADVEDSNEYDKARFPAVCLYECSRDGQYSFSMEETSTLVSLMDRLAEEILGLDKDLRDNFRINTVELMFGLAASCFSAIQQQHQNVCEDDANKLRDTVCTALRAFDRFVGLESEQNSIQVTGKAARDRPEEPLIITRKAVKSVVDSLLWLVNTGHFAPSEIDLVGTLVQHLTTACSGRGVFDDTIPVLGELRALCPAPQQSPPSFTPMNTAPPVALQASGLNEEVAEKIGPSDAASTSPYGEPEKDVFTLSQDELLAAEPVISEAPYRPLSPS